MAQDSIEVVQREADLFFEKLKARGWLAESDVTSGDTRSASDLFQSNVASRPLVVGLFGGTGVGKSTLLNRLAGNAVAKTGVVRPTSIEITAYLHESVELESLPASFSVSNFNCVKHHNEKYKDVMWVDMPDFDSDETDNREQVLQWIPHIDLLIYVVTPERYRDEQGWKLLMSEGYRHGWLFVMNQWDKAEPSQFDDFVRLLNSTGFNNPQVFKTVGIDKVIDADQFTELADLIANLAERNVVEQLEQVGWFRRLGRAYDQLQQHQKHLEPADENIVELFDRTWRSTVDSVTVNLSLPIQQYASGFAATRKSPLKNAVSAVTDSKADANKVEHKGLARTAGTLWDDWSKVKLRDAVTDFELATEQHRLPHSRLTRLRADSGGIESGQIGNVWSDRVQQALAQPGPAWQRSLHKVLSVLKIILPIAAFGWIASRVLSGFVNGASDPDAYVGTEFLTNGLLLVAVSWILPWLAGLLCRPSIPKAVGNALHDQLQTDLNQSVERYRQKLVVVAEERTGLHAEADALAGKINTALSRSTVLQSKDMRPLLMHAPGESDSSGKRPD